MKQLLIDGGLILLVIFGLTFDRFIEVSSEYIQFFTMIGVGVLVWVRVIYWIIKSWKTYHGKADDKAIHQKAEK